MQFIENYPQGYWQVADQKFINKYQALLHSTKTRNPVHYRYFDDVWENFDRNQLGKYPLKELYKQRAQQLRDSYDYLILYFSGGADSYNALRSFLDNGIHLDEICVKWAKDVIDNNIYQPNTEEVTALNYLSEWDYAIKPVLEEVAQKHPNIKIEILDWFKDKGSIGREEVFSVVNHWHDVEVTSLAVWSPRESELTEKGKKVAGIYGIDKPQTYFEDGNAYMIFLDSATAMGTPCPQNIYGAEYFYWSPKFPALPFEMAHTAIKAFNLSSDVKKIKLTRDEKTDVRLFMLKMGYQQKFLRYVIYDNWTGRFQAIKPVQLDRSDKHFWLWKYNEVLNYKDGYVDMSNMHFDAIDRGHMIVDQFTGKRLYRQLPSKKHFVSKE